MSTEQGPNRASSWSGTLSRYAPANEGNRWQHSPDGDVHAQHELDVERAVFPKRVEAPRVRALGHDGAEEREGTEDGDEGDGEEGAQVARRRRTDVNGLHRAEDSSRRNDGGNLQSIAKSVSKARFISRQILHLHLHLACIWQILSCSMNQ